MEEVGMNEAMKETGPEPSPIARLAMDFYGAAGFIGQARMTLTHGIANAPTTLHPLLGRVYEDLATLPGFGIEPPSVEAAVERYQGKGRALADCAVIVLAHSVVDAHLLKCIRAVAAVAPEEWDTELAERKVSYSLAVTGDAAAIRREKVEAAVDALDRDSSMPRKMALLLALCRPPSGWHPIEGYRWDPGRLATIDETRHRIVHNLAFQESIESVEEDFEYLVRTGGFAISLLRHRYEDPLNIPPAWRK